MRHFQFLCTALVVVFVQCPWLIDLSHAQNVTPDEERTAELLYENCSIDKDILEKLLSESSLPQPNGAKFCRCLGDYLASIMTDSERTYVATFLAPPPSLVEKEHRAAALCIAVAPP